MKFEKLSREIAEINNEVVGGGGIYPTDGLPADTCELVKMYLLPHARGTGLGRTLIEKSLAYAKEAGYRNVYLETMPELKQALNVYAKFGFEYLNRMKKQKETGEAHWTPPFDLCYRLKERNHTTRRL